MARGSRFDSAVLERYVARTAGVDQVTSRHVGRVCGVAAATVRRWRRVGLGFYAADAAAIALDTHPALIWPSWFAVESLPGFIY